MKKNQLICGKLTLKCYLVCSKLQNESAQMPIHFLVGLLGKSSDAKAGQHKNRPVSKCCFSCVLLHIFHAALASTAWIHLQEKGIK